MILHFTVPGKPVSWKRDRHAIGWMRGAPHPKWPPAVRRVLAAVGLVPYAKVYRDKSGKVERQKVAIIAKAAAKSAGWRATGGPVSVSIVAVYARPKNRPVRVPPEAWATGRRVMRPTAGSDDVDRLPGMLFDAMTDAGIYADDGMVCRLVVEKCYAADGEGACVEVEVEAMGWLGEVTT